MLPLCDLSRTLSRSRSSFRGHTLAVACPCERASAELPPRRLVRTKLDSPARGAGDACFAQTTLESLSDSLHAGATALAAATASNDVVYLKHFRLTWVDPQIGEDRLKARPERLELLLGVPNLADLEVAV